jgi:shikimate kinase
MQLWMPQQPKSMLWSLRDKNLLDATTTLNKKTANLFTQRQNLYNRNTDKILKRKKKTKTKIYVSRV